MRSVTLVTVLMGLLVASAGVAAFIWHQLGDVELSGHGIAALILGTLFSLGLGVGLMGLVFYSSRHGFDEQAQRED
ncbi:MAG: hypothetical protein AAF495_18640 [Pseudomonadota bacterium]